jgi:hypothetical protein
VSSVCCQRSVSQWSTKHVRKYYREDSSLSLSCLKKTLSDHSVSQTCSFNHSVSMVGFPVPLIRYMLEQWTQPTQWHAQSPSVCPYTGLACWTNHCPRGVPLKPDVPCWTQAKDPDHSGAGNMILKTDTVHGYTLEWLYTSMGRSSSVRCPEASPAHRLDTDGWQYVPQIYEGQFNMWHVE